MPVTKKLLIGGLNTDDSEYLLDPKEYIGGLNIRFATSENGKALRIENVEGNVLKNTTVDPTGNQIAFNLPAGTNTTIGAIEDTPNKRVFFFNKNASGTSGIGSHGIYCYDANTNLIYTVLKSTQIEGGLDFSNNIHSIAIIDDMLYWTDGDNPQRRINVNAAIKLNHPSYSTQTLPYITLVVGDIVAGTSYTNGIYANVSLTGGSGSGATATITVAGNKVNKVRITNVGSGYLAGDQLSALSANIGGTGSGFSFTNKGIEQSVISLIRNQPWSPITTVKNRDNTYVNNFIKTEAFQFAYRFVYRDFEVSTFSPLSDLTNYNLSDSSYASASVIPNRVQVTIPANQKIPQDVIRIEVAVKFALGGNYFIVQSFEEGFDLHNAGDALNFNFYNDKVGYAVDGASAVKPFDSIPQKSFTLEIAKNRLFLGNNTDGYEAPKSTSLVVGTTTGSANAVTGSWQKVVYSPYTGGGAVYTIYLLLINGISTAGYYRRSPEQETPPGTGDVNYNDVGTSLFYIGPTNASISQYLDAVYGPSSILNISLENTVNVTNVPSGQVTSLVGQNAFKSDSTYRVGVVFYDEAGRKCGVTTKSDAIAVIPDRAHSSVSYVTDITWALNNVDNSEIPDWARYYSIVVTKNLRTSSFFQLLTDDMKYATRDASTGVVNPSGASSHAANNYGVAIKASSLFSIGLGYAFNPASGDVIKLYKPSGGLIYSLKIKDQVGEWIITDLIDLGSLSGTINTWLYEVYTPYTQSVDEPYYERSQVFKINNPGTNTREYSVVSGSVKGDITILSRSSTPYLVEAMSPNDAFWQLWNTNAGRPNIVLDDKKVTKKTSVYWSNPIILGSQNNGLSTFDALDQIQLPYEMTSIQKLQLVSKIESEGTVMLAIGEQETVAMYLGESQVFDNTGSSFLAKSSGVVGNVNALRGSFGTINPESVVRYVGQVFWFDANKGCVVSYGPNGLFPISNNKMFKYFKKVGQDVLSSSLSFFGGFDPFHNEVLMFAPRKSVVPAGPRLLDMQIASSTYPFTTQSAASTIVVTGVASYAFTGSPVGPNTATVTGSTGAVTFSYVGTGTTTYGPSATRPSAAGTYSVTATVASDGAYDAATSAPFPFAIQSSFQFDADYMLLTYQFTDGADLDTRTRIVTPNVGQDAQSKYVGWSVQGVWPTTGTPILDWGGDNTGTGFESVLINLVALRAAYPSATTVVVDLRAFWYNTVGVNPVNVAAKLWKGGTPIEQGGAGSPAFSFTNPTATATFDIASVGKQITSDGSPSKSASSGERVATLTYNLVTNVGSFNSNDTTTPSV